MVVADSRLERGAVVLFTLGITASLWILVHPWHDRSYGDSALYVSTARSIAAGDGYTHLGAPFVIRPPGFPALLAPVVRAAGTDFFAFHFFVSAWGALAVVLLFYHERSRLSWIVALVTALVVWLDPGWRRLSNQVMSDVPAIALLFACLLVERAARCAPSWRREVGLGLCIALAAYVRPLYLLLVPAIGLSRVLERRAASGGSPSWAAFAARRLVVFSGVALLALAPWSLHARRHASPPPADQTIAYSYGTAMWHEDPGDPRSPRLGAGRILDRVPENVTRMTALLGSRVQTMEPRATRTGVALLLAAGLVAALVRRRAPAEIFAVAAALLFTIYYDFRDRLLLPVYVIAFVATVDSLRQLLLRRVGRRLTAGLLSAGLLVWTALDFDPRPGWGELERSHRAYAERCSEIESLIEPTARLATSFDWHYGVCLDRPVHSLWVAVRRANRLDAAEQIIDAYGIDTVVLAPSVDRERMLLPYFEQHYGDAARRGDSVAVFRVRPRGSRPGAGGRGP